MQALNVFLVVVVTIMVNSANPVDGCPDASLPDAGIIDRLKESGVLIPGL